MAKKKKNFIDDEYEEKYEDNDDIEEDDDFADDENEDEDSKEDALLKEDEEDQAMLIAVEREDEQTALSQLIMQEEIGFNPEFNFDSLTEKEKEKYESLILLTMDEAKKLAWKRLPHWQKWTLAMVCQKYSINDKFREICTSLIESPTKKNAHPGILYDDIHLELIRSYAEDGLHEQAITELDEFNKLYPQHEDVGLWIKALLLINNQQHDEGKIILDKIALTDTETGNIHHEIAAALLSINQPEIAMTYLEKAKVLAKSRKDSELTTAIDNCMKYAISYINRI